MNRKLLALVLLVCSIAGWRASDDPERSACRGTPNAVEISIEGRLRFQPTPLKSPAFSQREAPAAGSVDVADAVLVRHLPRVGRRGRSLPLDAVELPFDGYDGNERYLIDGQQLALKVPPGRHGMQPELEVHYDSSADNGWLARHTPPAHPLSTLRLRPRDRSA